MRRPETPLEASLPHVLGISFLAYICASSDQAIERYETGLIERQVKVLAPGEEFRARDAGLGAELVLD